MYFAQKGFAPILIILLTVLAVGSTTFLVFVSNPGLTNKINPSKTENTSSKHPTPTTSTTSPNTSSKNAFQMLKDKILPPKSSTFSTDNASQPTTQTNTVIPTPIESGPNASPTNIDTSKEISRYGSTEKSSPTSAPAVSSKPSSKPVSPDENIPIYYK